MSNELIKKLSSTDFKSTIAKGVTLIDFFAEWCGPCRMQIPALEEIAQEMQGKVTLCKVDIDQAGDITAEYRVSSVPTLLLFKDGKEVNRAVGVQDVDSLREFIQEAQ